MIRWTKGDEIREILGQGTTMLLSDIAKQVGCTEPRVLQIMSEMKKEGEFFDSRQAGRRMTYRLLLGDEKRKRQQDKRRLRAQRDRRSEKAALLAELATVLADVATIQTKVEDIRRRLDALAP